MLGWRAWECAGHLVTLLQRGHLGGYCARRADCRRIVGEGDSLDGLYVLSVCAVYICSHVFRTCGVAELRLLSLAERRAIVPISCISTCKPMPEWSRLYECACDWLRVQCAAKVPADCALERWSVGRVETQSCSDVVRVNKQSLDLFPAIRACMRHTCEGARVMCRATFTKPHVCQ